MARVAGVDLPKNKRIDVALCYLHGVGKSRAKEVMQKLSGVVKPEIRVKDLTEQQIGLINTLLTRSEEHTSELQSLRHLLCRLLLGSEEHTSEPVT